MKSTIKRSYFYLVAIPSKLYPFATEIEGRIVRGQRAYEMAVAEALEKYGFGKLGYKLLLYREVFHFFGSILFIIAATLISKELFGSDVALYVMLGVAIGALTLQEFYLHPKIYGQHTQKGVADWVVWVTPMMSYIYFFN